MSDEFYRRPILNSPYAYPREHWRLDGRGLPTPDIVQSRRRAEFITPIPAPKKRKGADSEELFDESLGLGDGGQKYDAISIINELRGEVDKWRRLPNERDWMVTPDTARLLKHWRHYARAPGVDSIRPFFCQIEAAEAVIWLTEVAPRLGKAGRRFLEHLKKANEEANPGLSRLALKLATGAGKTTVMAMLIACRPSTPRGGRGAKPSPGAF